ncbi:MAG: hypothetical protein H6728_10415 [Myxococcales bacterium]|nr:hypothetical protein [Myxococcales bacterium]MCB9643471.1 hypothetical protein [Myxococcales bacterium]
MSLHSPFRQALLALSAQAENGLICRDLQELPEDCPWLWGQGYTPQQFIEEAFSSVASAFGGFVDYLKQHCVDVLVVFFHERWWIAYDMGEKERCFVGAEPNFPPQLSEEVIAAGWEIPPALVELGQIHDGFGCAYVDEFALELEFFGGHQAVFPSHALMLPEVFWPDGYTEALLQEQQDAWGADPARAQREASLRDLLFFMTFPDGGGAAFVRSQGDVQGDEVVVWGEGQPLSASTDFFAFLQKHLVHALRAPVPQLDEKKFEQPYTVEEPEAVLEE